MVKFRVFFEGPTELLNIIFIRLSFKRLKNKNLLQRESTEVYMQD
jgi:hypothetical protein